MMFQMNTVVHGDCPEVLKQVPPESVALIPTDPPFNIGLKYRVTDDRRRRADYLEWQRRWLYQSYLMLKPGGSIYVCQGDAYAAETKVALEDLGFQMRNWIVWYYTFGENQRSKFGRCHTHILYFVKPGAPFTFNADAIKILSKRQIAGDKRAKAGGKVPDDVWQYSRVCGSFKERVFRADGTPYPCQMPQALMERIVKVSSNPGDLVVDPFCGTGTSVVAAQALGRNYWSCDHDPECIAMANLRLGASVAAAA